MSKRLLCIVMGVGLLVLCMFLTNSLRGEYKKIDAFGDTLCNLIMEYIKNNSASTSQDIINFVNSDATATVFSDAKNSGYERDKVLYQAYQASFSIESVPEYMIDGLHDVLKTEEIKKNIIYYSMLTNMGATLAIIMALLRHFYVYMRFDRPALNFYKSNNRDYLNSTLPEPIIS